MSKGKYQRTPEIRARNKKATLSYLANSPHPRLGKKHTPETIERIRVAHIGISPSDETRKKLSLKLKGKSFVLSPLALLSRRALRAGDRSNFWKGGITPVNKRIRSSLEYKAWRKSVFERDNYACVLCKAVSQKGVAVELNADHIKPFSQYPELRFELSNGRTLCRKCHLQTDTFGIKSRIIVKI